MSNAQQDILYRQEQLTNRVDNLIIRMGQVLLPAKEWLVSMGERAVSNIDFMTKSKGEQRQVIQGTQDKSVSDKYGSLLSQVSTMTEAEYQSYLNAVLYDRDKYKAEFERKTNEYKSQPFYNFGLVGPLLDNQGKLEYMDEKTNNDRHFDLARSRAFGKFSQELEKAWTTRGTTPNPITTPTGNDSDTNGKLKGLGDDVSNIVGSAKTPRNITINIDAFNKGGITTQNTSVKQMDDRQLEDWFTELCMRVVRNVETSYN